MLANDIQTTLQQKFGFDHLRPGQQQAIECILSGRSAAAIFPTGSGKSLCYQLPALHLSHLTLVISPLLALIKDQIDFLKSKGIAAASIDSSLDRQQINQTMSQIKQGQIKILMISVERLKNESFRNFIKTIPISLMVIDEAHCISEWGHNFRPDYLKLPDYQREFSIKQVLLLTATATKQVVTDMAKKFSITQQDIVRTGFYRKNLNLKIEPTTESQKNSTLFKFLKNKPHQSSIVYVTLQKTAERVANFICQQGIKAKAYHAGLNSDVRQEIQQTFMANSAPDQAQINCIVATIAFGMGIDKSDIRNVIHYDLPKSIENYSQEIGRAGRDGLASDCLVLANRDNINVLENFVYGDTPELTDIRLVLTEIEHAAKTCDHRWEFTLNSLSSLSRVRQLPLKTLLVYLELAEIIKPQYSYFAEYKFKLLVEQQELINKFDGERAQFMEAIFDNSQKAKIWFTLDMTALQANYQTDRQRVIAALDYFHEKEWISLETKQMTEMFQVTTSDRFKGEQTIELLADSLFIQFKQKEQAEITRIQNLLDFFESQQCITRQLCLHFDDRQLVTDCGHCSVCLSGPVKLPTSHQLISLTHFDPKLESQSIRKIADEKQLFLSNEMIAKFFCGITNPLLGKLRVRKLPEYGKFELYRFFDVLAWLNRH